MWPYKEDIGRLFAIHVRHLDVSDFRYKSVQTLRDLLHRPAASEKKAQG
jgi:hypothetical protein